jgi:hypothetical protein
MSKSTVLRSAWLITWESFSAPVSDEKKVVAIFNYRWGGRKIREYIEQLYVSSEYSVADKVRVARDGRDKIYPAEFARINGVPWHGEIHCGHNPLLRARIVRNVRTIDCAAGVSHLVWDEVRRPKIMIDD